MLELLCDDSMDGTEDVVRMNWIETPLRYSTGNIAAIMHMHLIFESCETRNSAVHLKASPRLSID